MTRTPQLIKSRENVICKLDCSDRSTTSDYNSSSTYKPAIPCSDNRVSITISFPCFSSKPTVYQKTPTKANIFIKCNCSEISGQCLGCKAVVTDWKVRFLSIPMLLGLLVKLETKVSHHLPFSCIQSYISRMQDAAHQCPYGAAAWSFSSSHRCHQGRVSLY